MTGDASADPQQRPRGGRLAAQLRRLRAERTWTREHLADTAGVSPQTVARLERGDAANPGVFTVAALAEALETPLDALLSAARHAGTSGLLSAGYEGRSLDRFVEELVDRDVQTLADVRLTPISRKPGFSKTRLSGALAEAGIGYRHLRALGNPKENRPPFWEGRFDEGRSVFRELLTARAAAAELDELLTLAARERVAVFCFEQDEDRCHRQVICDIARNSRGLPVSVLV